MIKRSWKVIIVNHMDSGNAKTVFFRPAMLPHPPHRKNITGPMLFLMAIILKKIMILRSSMSLITQSLLPHHRFQMTMEILMKQKENAEYILTGNAKKDTDAREEERAERNHAENGGNHAILEYHERRTGSETQTAEE